MNKQPQPSLERSWVEINLDSFQSNLAALKRYLLPWQQVLQIVKADAYGHGALEIAHSALDGGAVYLGVANLDEGRLLRLQGIKAPILILSPALASEIADILDNNLTPTISDLSFATTLSAQAKKRRLKVSVHLKVDTGMHRSGFALEEFLPAVEIIRKMPGLHIEGIFSHYAASEADVEFTERQSDAFLSLLGQLSFKPEYIHLANSSALPVHACWHTNLVRLGILSYGIYTAAGQRDYLNLKTVMTFKSTLMHIKAIKAGDYLGYNLTWRAPCDGQFGIVPVGYADGYDYLLGNNSVVQIKGRFCPVIGKISMDMLTIDLTSFPEAAVGDEVILMGGQTNLLRAEQLAGNYHGSAYELLCQVGRRARRHYYQDGQLISSSPLSRRDFVSSDYDQQKLSRIIHSAINQRLQDGEIADLVYREVLRGFFYNKDQDIAYRRDFRHNIRFLPSTGYPDYWQVQTTLSFRKKLTTAYFIVACANNDEILNRYFQRKDVEYRWLMDANFQLTPEQFRVTRVTINELVLSAQAEINQGCLEITCSHEQLAALAGREVHYQIDTQTLYPRSAHQLSVFITELTKGVTIIFDYPEEISAPEPVAIFSGQNKYPVIHRQTGRLKLQTAADSWVFPNSGIVIAY